MYHLRQALLAMRANLTATLSTLTTMTLTLLTLGGVLLLTLNVNRTLERLESQVEVAAYLTPQADGDALLRQVRAYPGVTEARLVSSEEILAEMTRDYPSTRMAARLAGNPFPDTLRLRLSRVEDSRQVAQRAKALPGVSDVEYGEAYVDSAVRALTTVRGVGYGMVALLLIGTLFNILNAVRVAMFARRNEISIMKLLGATRSFIRMPHLMEGMLVGLASAVLAVSALWIGYRLLAERLILFAPIFPIVTNPDELWPLLIGVGLLGIIIGLVGSLFATQRYLRELE